MEFKEIKDSKESCNVVMLVSKEETEQERPFDKNILNEWVFENKDVAKKYFNEVIEYNNEVIKNNTERMSGMPQGVEHLSDFVSELKKKQSIGKKLSKDMDKVINVWEARQGLIANIDKTKRSNELMEEVLGELNKLK
jgi:hypothetical protein